jgi:hypothetical protein
MRKHLFVFTMAIVAFAIMGQSLRKTEKIEQNQVPVAIQDAFTSDFGTIPSDGYWTANFIVEREGTRSVAKPLSYTYHKRNQSDRIEIRYTADGKLDFVKGLEKRKMPTT